jgi:hypothetical protein
MCPKCGCKVTYPIFNPHDYSDTAEDKEICANCGYVFWIEDADDDDELEEDKSD